MKKAVLFLVAIFFLSFVFNSYAIAQEKKINEVSVVKKQVAKSRGENPNIKVGRAEVINDNETPAPASKGGEKSRGDYCTVTFSSYVPYYVDIYVDGKFKGTLSPWADGTVTVYSGYTTIYCVTTNDEYEWLADGNCDGEYIYKLR